MTQSQKKSRYYDKLHKVCQYIEQHLDDDLSLKQLSELAHCSAFHFHRLFTVNVGISLYKYQQRLRMKRASYQLAFSDESITEIAFIANFNNSESFSRAFKKTFAQTPSQFRKKAIWESWYKHYQFNQMSVGTTMDIKFVDFPEVKIAAFEHQGPIETLNYSIGKFIQWRKQSKASPIRSSQTFGVVYHDPESIAPQQFRFDICGEVSQPVPENDCAIVNKAIPAGICAMYQHRGSHDVMDPIIREMYRQVCSDPEQQLRDFPLFFRYYNFFGEVAEHELITDIYLPVTYRP